MSLPIRPNLFIATGNPKTGTTFLQRMLNLHPQVSCPSEMNLTLLREATNLVLDRFQEELEWIDRNTGGQGAPKIRLGTRSRALRDLVLRLSIDFAGGKPIHGINDNTIIRDLPRADEQFRQPRIIMIFRDYVDISVSAWRHNHRLARTDPENAKKHLAVMRNPKGSLEGFIEKLAKVNAERNEAALAYAEGRENFLAIRYEDLAHDKATHLKRILDFLEAEADDATIQFIADNSSREAMAKSSKTPAFFGVGKDAEPPVSVSADFRREMEDIWITPRMEALGYRKSAG